MVSGLIVMVVAALSDFLLVPVAWSFLQGDESMLYRLYYASIINGILLLVGFMLIGREKKWGGTARSGMVVSLIGYLVIGYLALGILTSLLPEYRIALALIPNNQAFGLLIRWPFVIMMQIFG